MSRKLPQVTRRTLDEIARDAGAPEAAAEPGPDTGPDPVPGATAGSATGSTAEPAAAVSEPEVRRVQAQALVDRFTAWTAIGGAVPLPFLDLASIAVLQVQLVRRLAALYERPFSGEAVRGTLMAAAASVLSAGGGNLAGMLLARSLPWGQLLNMWVSSGLAAVTTQAIGRAYVLHFESGGTALDLEPATLAEHYRRALAERKAA